jgi:hypothetical protein
MADEEEIPEYIKEMQKDGPVKNNTNFGLEDIAWAGGDSDVEELTSKFGQDPFSPLQMLLFALIKGNSPDVRPHEILTRTQKALTAITGKPASKGKPKSDYHLLLLEIGWLYYAELFDNGLKDEGIKLREIIRSVIHRNLAAIEKQKNVAPENLERVLERKFNKNKELYLARATTDNDWGRMDGFSDLSKGLKLLAKAGISIDPNAVQPTRLAKNTKI